MNQALVKVPAVVRATSLSNSIHVEPLTCTIGAELGNVNLGAAAEDDLLMAEIRALLLKHRVIFFRDQDITRAQHVAFARRLSGEEAMRLDAVARRRREAWACRRFLSCAQAPKHLAQFMEREASTWFEKVVQIRPSLILECCAKDTGVKIRRRG